MTDSYGWFQSSASTSHINLVAGLQVRNQRSSTSAISDSDSSSSTPWDRLFWGPKTPLLRQLEATEAPWLLRACASCQAGSCRQRTDLKETVLAAILIYIGGCLLYIINRLILFTWNDHLKANRNIWKVKKNDLTHQYRAEGGSLTLSSRTSLHSFDLGLERMGGPARVYVGGMPGSQNRYKKIKYFPTSIECSQRRTGSFRRNQKTVLKLKTSNRHHHFLRINRWKIPRQ